jgi:hypothetical protein
MGIQQYQKSIRKVIKGTIYLGFKDEGKNRPQNSEYFIFDEAPEVEKVFGKQASEFHVRFPSSNPEIIIPSAYELWKYTPKGNGETNARLFCKGNGPDPETGSPGIATWSDIKNLPPADEWLGPVNSVAGTVRRQCWGDGCRGEFQACSSLYDSSNRTQCKPIMRILCVIPEVHPYDLYRISTRSVNAIMNFMSWFDHASRRGEVTKKFYKIFRYSKAARPYDATSKKNYDTTITTLGITDDHEEFMIAKGEQLRSLYQSMVDNTLLDGDKPVIAAAELQALPPSEFEETPVTRPAQIAAPDPAAEADKWLEDPEIKEAIKAFEEATGMEMGHKAKNIAVQQRLHLPDVKKAVLESLRSKTQVALAKKHVPTEPVNVTPKDLKEKIEDEFSGLEDQKVVPTEQVETSKDSLL